MSDWIAALPMYDWPERHVEVDAEWATVRDRLRVAGIDAPDALTRAHEDLYDFWRRPDILLSQTCWGPMEDGLASHVVVVGQPGYNGIEGGQGEYYSSAIVMRGDGDKNVPAPQGMEAVIPLELMRGRRFAYNNPDSMSGLFGITRDLEAAGEGLRIFSSQTRTGGHRHSIRAVAAGEADVAAIDCYSWQLAQLYEPPASALKVVGWTAKRKGLPYITSNKTPPDVVAALKAALA